MQRRDMMIAAVASLGALASGCSTTANTTTTTTAPAQAGDKRHSINVASHEALSRLYANVHGSRELVEKARGVLVFPGVIAAGLGVGGEYGEGELLVGGSPVSYYSTASASFGLQIGAQSKAVFFLFMTEDALDRFRGSHGWTAGVDASVAVLKVGANGDVNVNSAQAPITGFVLTNAGLMANATVQGTKITQLDL